MYLRQMKVCVLFSVACYYFIRTMNTFFTQCFILIIFKIFNQTQPNLIISTMNVEERLEEQEKENIALKAKVQMLETANIQHVKNIASLEEKYQNEMAELKGKLSEQNEVFEEKLKKLEEVIHTNKQKISEAEDEIMMAIHQMKILLPPENWHDLLAFVPRSQLGNLVPQIGDYQFTDILQSFLHGFGKIKLGKMEIIAPRPNVSSDRPMVQVMPNEATNMPDSSMPGNIKDFKEIELNCVDASVLQFLGTFQQNSLLTDVNMHFHYYLDEDILPRVLPQIVPFITSIDSIESRGIDLFAKAYKNNTNHELQLLLKEMMAKARILLTAWYIYGPECSWGDLNKMDWFCSWLYTPRNDGKPRMLRLYHNFVDTPIDECGLLLERIKKDFKMAKHADDAVSFFIYAISWNDYLEEISIDNVKTNEKLVIKKMEDHEYGWKVFVSRYPLNAAKNWIEANEKEITTEWNRETLDRKITLPEGLTTVI